MDAANTATNHTHVLRQNARDFFELGEAFAYSQTAFSQVRFQAKIFGGDFERTCLDVQDKLKNLGSLSGERLDAGQVRKDLLKIDRDLHCLQTNVVSALLASKQSGYDVVG
jgi:hypothetical protein